jgi:hypothetical protein
MKNWSESDCHAEIAHENLKRSRASITNFSQHRWIVAGFFVLKRRQALAKVELARYAL